MHQNKNNILTIYFHFFLIEKVLNHFSGPKCFPKWNRNRSGYFSLFFFSPLKELYEIEAVNLTKCPFEERINLWNNGIKVSFKLKQKSTIKNKKTDQILKSSNFWVCLHNFRSDCEPSRDRHQFEGYPSHIQLQKTKRKCLRSTTCTWTSIANRI